MKSTTRIALGSLAALVLIPFGAQARDTGFYLGGSVGQSQVEVVGDTTIPEIPEFSFDENDTAWKIFGGYNWNLPVLNVAVEGGYVNFGKPSQTFVIDSIPVNLDIEPTGLNAWGIVGIDVGPVDLFGKLGLVFWDADFTASVPSIPGASDTDSDDGNDIAYGIGGRLNLGKLGLRLEYEIYDIEDSEDVSMWSLGAEWRF